LVTATNNKSKPVTRPVNYTKNRNEKPRENSETTRKANTNAASWLMTCTTNFPHPLFRKAPENRLACLQFEALLSFSVAQTKRQNAWATTTHLRQTHAEILAKLLVALATFGGFIGGERGSQGERCFTGHRMDFWLCGRNGMSLDRFGFGISRRRVQEPKSLADIDNNPATQWFHKREMKRRR